MPDVELLGCRTRPLLSYLKALGVFRHAAQADSAARLWWHLEGFAVLRSRFDESELVKFFLEKYEPSPITSPWNGSSGYFEDDLPSAKQAIEAVERTTAPRLHDLRVAIEAARRMLAELGIAKKPDPKTQKPEIIAAWRAECPDAALAWVDAAVVLGDQTRFNPILGTGGNSGNMEFSRAFHLALAQCLPSLFDEARASDAAMRSWLMFALFELGDPALTDGGANMFEPGTAGMPNSASSASDRSTLNPWDWVLLLEGSLLFAGGVARRLGSTRSDTAFPFTTFQPLRIGGSSDDLSDAKLRGETWLPIWHKPASLRAITQFLAEGRIQDGRRQAHSARDMLRGTVTLGVDRGVASFERVIYAERWGQTTISVPGGRLDVRAVRSAELTRAADPWLGRVRRVDTTSVHRCLGALDRAAAELAAGADETAALERWLLALAETQLAVGRRPSSRATSDPTHIRPLGALPWRIVASLQDSVEHRLARALAAVGREPGQVGLRTLVEPVTPTRGWSFAWEGERAGSALSLLRPEPLLVTLAQSTGSLAATPPGRRAHLADVAAFLAGQTDDERLVRLAYVFSLCEPCNQRAATAARSAAGIDRLYAAARLVTCDSAASRPGGAELAVGPAPEVLSALAAGKAAAAARAAVRRLRADGLAPLRSLEAIDRPPHEARRIAAALAFPLHPDDRGALERIALLPEPATDVTPTTTEGVIA